MAERWDQPICPSIDEWTNTQWSVHTMEYYSAVKRNEVMALATTWMDLENMMLMKEPRHKAHMVYASIYMKYLEYANL